jgi:cyclophilin family peptidyl-prolyl cis-trans isomerase/HEAT repeat protein
MTRAAGALARGVVAAGLALAGACGKTPPPPGPAMPDAQDVALPAPSAAAAGAIARAEDRRRARDVPEDARTGPDPAVRRLAARALARIADPASEPALLQALSDEDEETVGWAAYGLGWACKGHEEAHVRALAARAVSLGDHGSAASSGAEGGAAARAAIDARTALVRAVGRCGGDLAEQVLSAWVRARGGWAERAALALGDVAGRHGQLGDETATTLLDAAAQPDPGAVALYPFARVEKVNEALAPRVLAAARAALAHPGESRAFAIRALSRSGREAAADLLRVVESKDFTASERAEAARGMKQLGEAGRAVAAEALGRLTPDKDPFAITALGGDDFGVLRTLVGALADGAPKAAEPALRALAALRPPGDVPAPLARRLAELRCSAAGLLARGAYDNDLLARCDGDGSSEAAQRARLAAVAQRPLVGDRRGAWRALVKSPHVRVEEAALELINDHPELAEGARVALAEALGSDKPGPVTTAAEVLHAHPDRVLVLAEREKRAALDPNAPPPTANPARDLDAPVARALQAALGRPWAPDLVETRSALVDAAVAVRLAGAREAATSACHDANVTMREHAVKALRALGDAQVVCAAPEAPADADAGASRTDPPLARPTRVTFATDAGTLSITFEPELAPVAASRFVALARAGFYKGIIVHRVVPGFVVQLGDPGGDGYGGSGELLRCETSPVPFARLDVGVALAGRDTGSSQIFVALARVPHLDGEYARVGRAEGDWDAVAEGDAITDATVE